MNTRPIVLFLSLCQALSLQAAVLVSDFFDSVANGGAYAAGNIDDAPNINATTGTIGWGGNWDDGPSERGSGSTSNIKFVDSSLLFQTGATTFLTDGGYVGFSPIIGDSRYGYRPFDTSTQTGTESEYWTTFVFQAGGSVANPSHVRLYTDGTDNPSFGLVSDDVNLMLQAGTDPGAADDTTGWGSVGPGTLAYSATYAHLVFMRVLVDRTGANPETISLWVDPADLTSQLALGVPSLTYSANFINGTDKFSALEYRGGSTGGGNLSIRGFDNFNLGTSFNDVVFESRVLPEPGTLGLFLLGSLALRRRMSARNRTEIAA